MGGRGGGRGPRVMARPQEAGPHLCPPTECLPGHFGAGCQRSCRCLHGGLCDLHTGGCLCPAGWTGDTCQSRKWAGPGQCRVALSGAVSRPVRRVCVPAARPLGPSPSLSSHSLCPAHVRGSLWGALCLPGGATCHPPGRRRAGL